MYPDPYVAQKQDSIVLRCKLQTEIDIYIMTGNRLKLLRKERSLTVADLAKLLGCPPKNISHLKMVPEKLVVTR
jgi:hypothetical protein